MKNIYLIGLSGCGKTTLAVMLADRAEMDVLDTDEWIQKRAGMTIPEIFKQKGEEAFRDMETLALRETSGMKNAIVSTGGGSILREENVRVMRGNGRIVWINRPVEAILSDIDMSARPLAGSSEALLNLAGERMALYKAACDIEIINDACANKALEALIKVTEEIE